MIKKFYDIELPDKAGGNMPNKDKISVQELYNFITKRMTCEEALMKLLSSSLIKYDKLKINNPEDMVHPEIIIAMAAMDLGWDIAVEGADKSAHIQGLVVGTSDYMDKIFNRKKKEDSSNEL